ncbi:hypothetical protein [Paenibacillus sp. NPDC057967]|uniref:hypothetical protein n=1 Tax=Paenibacillus sp. NPDC057967 TaxID=3346293 RepID=UPI0036DE7692
MGNIIHINHHKNGHAVDSVSMSNGGTAVFLDVLALSGSDLAVTDREKEFIIWLNQRDQSIVGIGTVGFNINEMPWTKEGFAVHKKFLLSVIDSAANRQRWHVLSYRPNYEIIYSNLTQFRDLISAFQEEQVDESEYDYWSSKEEDEINPTIPDGFPKCESHSVLLSCHGCLICNFEKTEGKC